MRKEYTITDQINNEVRWAKDYFSFSDIEVIWFRNCFEEFYLGKADGKIRPLQYSCLKAYLLRGCASEDAVLLTALARVYAIRFRDYVELYLPDSLLEVVYPLDVDKLESAPDFIDIADDISKNMNDKLQGEHRSDWCKYNKKILLYINNAKEVEIRQTNNVLTKFKIVSNYGTLSVDETMLEMITEEKSRGMGFLSKIRDGAIIATSAEELAMLRCEVRNAMYFPNDDKNFSFGRQRNSYKKLFIESFLPLYRCLSDRIKIQSSPKFDSFSNRDYYQFILDMLEIPIDFICVDDMEFYLKSPEKIDLKRVNLDLPF